MTRVRIAVDRQRLRVPLPLMIEAGARMAFGYVRNQYGLRDRRPLGRYLRKNAEFLLAGRSRTNVQAKMAGMEVVLPTADRTIARSVFASGDWDPLLVGTVFDALRAYGHRHEGSVLLEIGANFGVYSLPAVAEYGFARAVAYEPDPGSYRLLIENVARNALAGKVAAHNAALSAEPGELVLSLGLGNAGDNRIVDAPERIRDRPTIRVPARTFDDEVAAGRIPLSELGLVWLDVQGHEPDVLAGASTLLNSDVPVVLEYASSMLAPGARRTLAETIAGHFAVIVDLGWSALTGRIRFQPADAVCAFAQSRQTIETDLLLLHAPDGANPLLHA